MTTKIEDWDVDQSLTGGTVILTSGNYGVYEMHKREILSYLMRGMNVMAFNFRGYGESSGNPTQRTVSRDLEAVYQYVKESHEIPDDKILFKALCMSGGAAAEVASNHPDVNLFIDQSYASFSDVIAKEAGDYLKEFADENKLGRGSFLALQAWLALNLMPLIRSVIQYLSPAWSVEKNIGKVKGHVGILTTKEDNLMSVDRDLFRNYQAVMESKQAKSASVYAMEGQHGDAWNNPADLSIHHKN